jgi:hypothetical protein
MEQHDEFDLLSAYLDGEIDAADRGRIDAHLTTCAECRATLAGLRATLADLDALPEPAPTPQDSWGLRAAIRRARSPMRRWQRYGYAAGAVAAAAIAIVAITMPNRNPARDLASSPQAAGLADLSAVPLITSSENLTALDAQRKLLEVAGVESRVVISPTPGAAAPAPVQKDSAGPGAEVTGQQLHAGNYAVDTESVRAQIDECVGVVRASTQIFLEPLRFDVASFEGTPAFFLFFHASDHYELWVMQREDCGLLYFGQTD